MRLNIGDLVKLKSGGPPMTIEHLEDATSGDNQVAGCVWFEHHDDRDLLNRDTFSSIILEPVGTGTIIGRVVVRPEAQEAGNPSGGGTISGRVVKVPPPQ
jgi:uncharacterized protein YodC (DUF2158 family)